MSVQLVGNSPWAQLPRALNIEVQSYLDPRDIATRTQLVCKRWHMYQPDLADILISQIRSKRRVFSADAIQAFTERLKIGGQIPRIMGAIKTLKVTRNYPWLQLQNARQLEELDCRSATLSDADIRDMSVLLPNVQILDFSGCAFLGDPGFPTIMENYPNVHSLSFYPKVTDAGLESVIRFYNNQLQVIDVTLSEITDEGFSKIAEYCPKLKKLILKICDITDRGLESVANLTSLQKLDLSFCRITDRGLESLAKLSNLRALILTNTQTTDRGLDSLAQISSLEELDCASCERITDRGLESLAKLSNLRALILRNTQTTDRGKRALMSQLPNLVI